MPAGGVITPEVVPDPRALADAAARWTADRVSAAVEARGACYLALAGGQTPRGCYQRLALAPYDDAVPWASVRLFWSDERQVPLDSPDSNYGMAKAALLDHVPIPPTQIFPLLGDDAAAIDGVPRNDAGWPRFDVIHLGLGEDGHTASIFPGSPAAEHPTGFVYLVDNAPKPPRQRLTLTLPVLNAASAVLFMVAGDSKREALARVLRRDPALPASRVQPAGGELHFIVDQNAFG
jgi:6-phosphogluconolactonase